ncbi:aromatic-L-amino-acid decarboxylase [Clavulina sp. PMI_390]|nr:aromatic-L-amino-acid decarboxylase [Clavulina sp. PMI_390]
MMPMDIEQFRKAAYAAIDHICDYYYSLENLPVSAQVEPGFLIKALPTAPPEHGESIEVIAADYQKLVLPGITHWQHPSFFGYYPSNASFPSIIADLYASAVTNPGFNWICSPSCTELENVTMDWAADLLGLSPAFKFSSALGGGGVLQTTASDSAFLACMVARIRFTRAHPNIPMENLILYLTTQTHSLGVKTARLLGLKWRTLDVKEEDRYALRGETVRKAYEEDREKGLWPFCLFSTLGTTSSGAADRMDEIGPIAQSFDTFWIHIDAAWAGVSLACPEFRERAYLDAINQYADSFCTNFHKWGLVSFDASTFWVRNSAHLTEAMDINPQFLKTKQSDAGAVVDYRNWQVALSRRFRSVKLWFVLRNYGVEGFRAHIRKCVNLGKLFESLIRAQPDLFEIVAPRSLALTVFRVAPSSPRNRDLSHSHSHSRAHSHPAKAATLHAPSTSSLSLAALNKLNTSFHQRLTEGPEGIFVITTLLDGKLCVRMSIGAERTQDCHIRAAVERMTKCAREVIDELDVEMGKELQQSEAAGIAAGTGGSSLP